jgi:hypothetical protein
MPWPAEAGAFMMDLFLKERSSGAHFFYPEN